LIAAPRQCGVCGGLAEMECGSCSAENALFCYPCYEPVHSHSKRRHHRAPQALPEVPEAYLTAKSREEAVPRLKMELFAVVCIETSHYVAFAKSGQGENGEWCFFDSMADRKGERERACDQQ